MAENYFSQDVKQWSLCFCTPNIVGEHLSEKRRLGIVISNNISNSKKIANIILCSTQVHKSNLPINYKFFCKTTGFWNIAMANQIITLPTIQLEQISETLSSEDIAGVRRALEVQFDSTLRSSGYEPEVIIQKQIIEKPIEIIKERVMSNIDEAYKAYLEAKAFEEEAIKQTEIAYEEYRKAFEDLEEKLKEHREILHISKDITCEPLVYSTEGVEPYVTETISTEVTSSKVKAHTKERWLPQDVKQLQPLVDSEDKISPRSDNIIEMAQQLKRAPQSVYMKVYKLRAAKFKIN